MTKILFFDTDCLCSFVWSKTEYLLVELFANNMQIPIQVYGELSRVPHIKERIDKLIIEGNLSIIDIEIDSDVEDLYINLIKKDSSSKRAVIGKGEAAALAHTKYKDGILASNNFRDVKYYVDLYNLKHIATDQIMKMLVDNGAITVTKANEI